MNNWYPILTYHKVSDNFSKDHYTITKKTIAEHFSTIKNLGYKFETIDEIGQNNNIKKIYICFDDVHKSFYEHAWEILQYYRIPVTLFITTNYIECYREYLNWQEIIRLSRNGMIIQSHGVTHSFLTKLSKNKLRKELQISKKIIEDKIGKEVKYISCPGGRFNENVLSEAQDSGYEKVFVSNPFPSKKNIKSGAVGRVMTHSNMNSNKIIRIISEQKIWKYNTIITQNTKSFLKVILGDKIYRNLWSKYSKYN